mgnify:FL=1
MRRRSPVYAPVAKLVYAMDLGDVTSVKVFRVGFDQQLLVEGFPYGKAIYAQIQIRDFALLKFFFFILNKSRRGLFLYMRVWRNWQTRRI